MLTIFLDTVSVYTWKLFVCRFTGDNNPFIKFPSAFRLTPSFIKITQALWLLDHQVFMVQSLLKYSLLSLEVCCSVCWLVFVCAGSNTCAVGPSCFHEWSEAMATSVYYSIIPLSRSTPDGTEVCPSSTATSERHRRHSVGSLVHSL